MALSNFFRINLPYGIHCNKNDEWFAFNREYVPLGWNSTNTKTTIHFEDAFSQYPIFTKYKALTEKKLLEIAGSEKSVKRNDEGKIITIFLYEDKTNPSTDKQYWDLYFDKLKILSQFVRK